jgi:hypothetical protein
MCAGLPLPGVNPIAVNEIYQKWNPGPPFGIIITSLTALFRTYEPLLSKFSILAGFLLGYFTLDFLTLEFGTYSLSRDVSKGLPPHAVLYPITAQIPDVLLCISQILKFKCLPFNAGIKSLRATLPGEIFTGDFSAWTVYFVNICVKTNKYTNY